MKEITREIKKQIFALYWSQKVLHIPDDEVEYMEATPLTINDSFMGLNKSIDLGYLLLNPLSSITDEDAIEVAIICGRANTSVGYAKEFITSYFEKNVATTTIYNYQYFKSIDFLRSKGYALPYLNLSVDDLVQAAVFKLKS